MKVTKRNQITRTLIVTMSALLLTACEMRNCLVYCHDGTEVQRVYVNARNDCQDLAEDKVHLFLDNGPGGGGPKQVNSALLALFAKCMHIQDWGVTAPKQENKQPIPASEANGTRARAGVGLAPGYSDQPVGYPSPQNFHFPQPVPYPNGRY